MKGNSMIRSFLAALAVVAPMSMFASAPADARVNVDLYFGVPHYNYNVGPGYIFRPGYGWYDRSYDRGYNRNFNRNRLSCVQGERYLERRGYNIRARLDCDGRSYRYRAVNARGRTFVVDLDARTRQIYRVR
jgi:hypothetical protein